MLRHTFCHLPGIGEKAERRLWASGVITWEAALASGPTPPAGTRKRLTPDLLRESLTSHEKGNLPWFTERLPSRQVWRLFGDFRAHAAYLDIETTGMGYADHITTICLYDGRTVRTYVHGENLADFLTDVQSYHLLITYNGKSFDIPILERTFGCRLPHAQIDLRYVLASLGLRGGLKGCERQLGMGRPGLEEVDGFVAVLLWDEYRRHRNPRSLETLLAYNIQDTVNLERLMVHAYNRSLAALGEVPFAAGHVLPEPVIPDNPCQADPDLIRRILQRHPWVLGGRRGE